MNSLAYQLPTTDLNGEDEGKRRFWPRGMWTDRGTREIDRVDEQSVERATQHRDRLVARLRALAHYGQGWDGEDASQPLRAAIHDAISVVANLTHDVAFHAAPEPDGSIELIAKGSKRKVILVMEGTGTVALFVIEPNHEPLLTEYPVPKFIGGGRELERALRAALA